MNRAVILKTFRDHRLMFALMFAAAVILPVLVIVAFSSTPMELMSQWMRLSLVRNLMRMLLGADLTDMLNRTSFAAFAFVHPGMLSLVWAFLIVITTAALVGEVDRGTADVLLSLPVSRWGLYVSVSVVVFGCGLLLAAAPWLGAFITERAKDWDQPLDLKRLLLVLVNNLAAIWAVAGVAMAVSASTSRRGVAVGILFGWLLVSFVLNFLGAVWEPAERLAFLGLLYYFRPLIVVRDASLDAGNIGVLAGLGVMAWTVGGFVFARRDIRTT